MYGTYRNANRESCAAFGWAFHVNPPAVEIDDPPGFGEAEAEAAAGFAAGEEGVEDVGADVGRDAGAGVGDGQF